MPPETKLLLVDDDAAQLRTLQVLLEDEGYAVEAAASGALALERLERDPAIRLVVTDLSMPGMDGLALLRTVAAQRPGLPVILVTAFGSVKSAVEAMRLGAFQYLGKPVDPDELLLQVSRALAQARLVAEHARLRERTGNPEAWDTLVGSGPAMAELRRAIERVAAVDSTVLVRGETGTGKELVARLIHAAGPRARQPFVTVNCTAIPGELIESEIFGHEKGAFTGAVGLRPGRIEEAAGGTLLLDEIGDMPPALQPKLLRFLQERTVRRVGGNVERRVDVRVVAATHRDLERAMADGAFRPDLYHRLDTIPVLIPPLRDRLEDLPELVAHLAAKISRRIGRPAPSVEPDALQALARYRFPGNVRELENLVERAIVLGGEGVLRAAHFGALDAAGPDGPLALPVENGLARLAALATATERDLIRRAVAAWPTLSNSEIADRLGTNRRVLELRMKEFGVVKP